ncbi:50S ribosomal protein L13 [candidate division WWE3 bacterium]|nr:50S ribosomal protein L13 [candidate division WWE3 bacterium]
MKTNITPKTITRKWFVIDASDKVLGRMTTDVALILQGKNHPYYSPQWDMGDNVIIINAEKVVLTGRKEEKKVYYRHTGHPGGLKQSTAGKLRQEKPINLIREAVKGMLPKNRLAKDMIKKLYVYTGSEHPHLAQQPEEIK